MGSEKQSQLKTDQKCQDIAIQDWAMNEIMDHMNTNIYVTDLENGEILFMNETMKRAFGIETLDGKKCWELLQKGMPGRCAFCPIDRLNSNDPEHSVYVWQEHNTKNGHFYKNYDSLMHWHDGRIVHFQHSVDVTEERRMIEAANFDELTGALSRRAGKEILQEKLDRDESFALCLLDVNGLKNINDTRGHQAGDAYLIEIVDAVRKKLKSQDCIYRMSGDEFVVVLDGADRNAATQVMLAAQDALRDPDKRDKFCYGIAEATEGISRTVSGLLSSADSALYYAKRREHILRAGKKLEELPTFRAETEEFEYDSALLYDAIVESTDDYLYVCNMKTGVFKYSRAMVEDFDLPAKVLDNAAAVWGARVHENDKAVFLESNQDITEGRTDSHCVEYRAKNRKGEWLWLRCRGRVVRDEKGMPALFAGFITNLGKKDKIDPLTGFLNKVAFEEECEGLLRAGGGVTAMIFGIDGLKRLNRLYNREFGDEVIRIVSQRIQTFLPPDAKVFRLDGDEFGVLIRGEARGVARSCFFSIKEAFSAQQSYDDKKFFCTLSCGCAVATEDVKYQEIRKRISFALDYAKRNGKNRIEFYTQDMLESMERSLVMSELLRESIENKFEGFRLVFQPIFDLNRRLRGAEALCRWTTPVFGEVAPSEFVELLEKNGLMIRTGKWIFKQAVKQCAEYLIDTPTFVMNINLSWLQLEDPSLPDYMRRTLQSFNVPTDRIALELTESSLAGNYEHMSELLNNLRAAGFRIAMDDFGTGYSSLSLLKHSPIDDVKLDMTFVRGIGKSPFNRAFIRMAVELCHIVGIGVCLEGVETQEEYEQIQMLGLDYLQGFLLGKPCEGERFAREFLEAHKEIPVEESAASATV